MTIAEKNEETLRFYFSEIQDCTPEREAEVRQKIGDLSQCRLSVDWNAEGQIWLNSVNKPELVALLADLDEKQELLDMPAEGGRQ